MNLFNTRNFILILIATSLTACSSTPKMPITFSIEQLGAEATTRNDEELGYRSSVAITGISAPFATGKLLSIPGKGLPDILSVPISTSCSRIIETIYESSATESDVATIASALEGLRTSLVNKAIAETKLQVLSNAKSNYNKSKSAGTLNSDPLLKTFSSALGLVEINETTLSAQEQILNKEILEENRKSNSEINSITSLNGKSNLYIFRWARAEESSISTSIGAIFSGAQSHSESKNGYLIAASLRSSALEYGDDLVIKLIRDKNSGTTGSDAVLKNTYITNYTLGAKHHYFSEDRDIAGAINASLKISASELDQIFGGAFSTFLQAQSLAVEFSLKNSITASARGLSTKPERAVYPFRLWGDLAFSASGDAERIRNNQYTTFYSTRSSLSQYQIDKLVEPKGSAVFQCLQMIPEAGPVESVNIQKIKYKFCSPLGWNTASGRASLGNTAASSWLPDTNACIEFNSKID